MKQCKRCGETKNERGRCSRCDRAWREAHREELAARHRMWREAHREERAVYNRKWNEANREHNREVRRLYAETHRAQITANHRAWYLAHDRRRAYYRIYCETHREKQRAYAESRRKAGIRFKVDPQKGRMYQHARYARKIGNGGVYTKAEWRILCEHLGTACLCCGTNDGLSVDHVVPLSRGGTNAIDNLQPLCCGCNRRKGTKSTDYRDPEKLAEALRAIESYRKQCAD